MKQSNIYRNIKDKSSGDQRDFAAKPGQDFNIVTNPVLEQFKSLISTYDEWTDSILQKGEKEKLRKAEEILDQDYSEGALNKILEEFQNRESVMEDPHQDIFASAAINQMDDQTVSVKAEDLSELNGATGLGYRNKSDVIIEGEVDDRIFKENMAGNVSIEGDVEKVVGQKMMGGTIRINGNISANLGAGHQMQGGQIIIDGYAETAGLDMENGYIRVTEDADEIGNSMEGGEIGSEQSVEAIARSAKGGIAWVNDDAEEVGNYAQGGLIYVAGDAEEIGRLSKDGEIYIEGEIGNIGKNCGADVYQWIDREWELVHEGEDQQTDLSQGSREKNSGSALSSQQLMETEESYDSLELEDLDEIYTSNDEYNLINDFEYSFHQDENDGAKNFNDEIDEKVEELDPYSEKSIKDQWEDRQ